LKYLINLVAKLQVLLTANHFDYVEAKKLVNEINLIMKTYEDHC
jgi:hypothetical protein